MGFLDGLLTGSATGLIKSIGEAINANVTSDEERISLQNELQTAILNHKKEMTALEIEKEKALFADIDSARHNQSLVQETEHASWLSKNVQPFLAIMVCGVGFGIFAKVLFGGMQSASDSGTTMLILGCVSALIGQIMSYFFGASTDLSELKGKPKAKKLP